MFHSIITSDYYKMWGIWIPVGYEGDNLFSILYVILISPLPFWVATNHAAPAFIGKKKMSFSVEPFISTGYVKGDSKQNFSADVLFKWCVRAWSGVKFIEREQELHRSLIRLFQPGVGCKSVLGFMLVPPARISRRSLPFVEVWILLWASESQDIRVAASQEVKQKDGSYLLQYFEGC